MSSVVDPQPDPSPADELVAYLDGELPPADCRRVENRLATDEDYRQQMHELDQAWEALDSLPANTVDDGFARTTIELACVAAEADLTEHTAVAKAAKRDRTRRWIAGGVAAVVVGFLAGRALVPNHNDQLVNDLPAIHQFGVLPYVEDVEFLRLLGNAVPPAQLVRDESTFDQNVKELESANSKSLETRRDWIKSLDPEQKAKIADRDRSFGNLEPSSGEQERMRSIMADIRDDPDAANLQKTLIAYGQWLSRHTDGQKVQLQEELRDRPPEEQAKMVANMIRREEGQPWRHLSSEDAQKLRDAISDFAEKKKTEFSAKMLRNHRGERLRQLERNPNAHSMVILLSELFDGNKSDGNKFEATADELVAKLGPEARTHWENLERGRRDLRKGQFIVWIRDVRPKLDPEELERFFASDELDNDRRQHLLDMQRPEMEAELKRDYLSTGMGFDAGQLMREFGEPGRMQRNMPGPGGPQWRPDGPRPDGPRPDGPMRGDPGAPDRARQRPRLGQPRPGDRPPANPPRQPAPNQPPKDQKPEAI